MPRHTKTARRTGGGELNTEGKGNVDREEHVVSTTEVLGAMAKDAVRGVVGLITEGSGGAGQAARDLEQERTPKGRRERQRERDRRGLTR